MSTFEDWAARGFSPMLLPIIPPGAKVAPTSTVPASAVGKTPGRKTWQGWVGMRNWQQAVAAGPDDLARWASWGASIGLRCGDALVAVDIDVTDQALADALEVEFTRVLGRAPLRVGRWPKRVLLYRVNVGSAVITKLRVSWLRDGGDGKERDAIEVLGNGQQFVADGIHPGTGLPYDWPRGRPTFGALGTVDAELVAGAWARVADLLATLGVSPNVENAGALRTDGGSGRSPDALRAPSIAALSGCLAWLPNGEADGRTYDDMLRMLAAIKASAAGLAEDGGRALAEAWFMQWPANTVEVFAQKWASLKAPFMLGWSWLAAEARARGFNDATTEFVPVPCVGANGSNVAGIGMLKPEAAPGIGMREPLAPSVAEKRMFERYVWVEEIERFFDTHTRELITDRQLSARHPEIGAPGSRTKCAAAVFVKNVGCRRYVRGVTYRPGRKLLVVETSDDGGSGRDCVNTWRPSDLVPNLEATDDDVRLWLDHVGRLLPDLREREHVLDFCAFVVQRQDEKVNHALVLGGGQGIGKDTMFEPITRTLGQHNVGGIGVAEITGSFTEWLVGRRLIYGQEMHSFTSVKTMDALKPKIAAPPHTVRVNIKNVNPFDVPNIHAYIFFTNHRDGVAFEDDDRRFAVYWSEASAPSVEYFDALWSWYAKGGFELVAGWLRKRDISNFNPNARAPRTKAKDAMRREGLSAVALQIAHGIEDHDLTDLVSVRDVQRWISVNSLGKNSIPDEKAVARAMRDAGAAPVGGNSSIRLPVTPGQSRYALKIRLWAVRDIKRYDAMTPIALGAEYVTCWQIMQKRYFQPGLDQ